MRNQSELFSGFLNNISKSISTAFILLICSLSLFAQEREELEAKRNKLISEIETTQTNLREASQNKDLRLQQLNELESKIEKRQALISNISASLNILEKEIAQNDSTLSALEANISEITNQYHSLLRYSYLKKLGSNKWTYILSSKSLNEAFLRWRYTHQYEQYCLDKAKEISELQQKIDSNNQLLATSKMQQEQLMTEESSQMSQLSGEKDAQKKLVTQLTREESRLKTTLDRQKKERERLNRAIEDAIVNELSKATSPELSRSNLSLAEAFASNKGKLPWPVKGVVKNKFGVQPHPSIPGLKIDNNGIDIESDKTGAEVTAIFSGKVIGITAIPGYDNMVIVQHGSFYTVYSRLITIYVTPDQNISTGQILGKLDTDKKDLHIELWKNKSKIDPIEWLRDQ